MAVTGSEWQRLSVRRGTREPETLFEGVPAHLKHPVGEWLRGNFGWFAAQGMNHGLMSTLASSLRLPVTQTHEVGGISNQIFQFIERDQELYLDCVDATLYLTGGRIASRLKQILEVGGSAWTVREEGTGLERRVPEASGKAYSAATAVGDSVTDELREAWEAAFGRNPDSSDAWDHAIKAVEDLLIPIVVPKVNKANLGTVAGELKNNPTRWDFGLPANVGRTNGETLEGMIRHMWPNPDRHGGAAKRTPSQSEAESVVHLAVLIVALCRGKLARVP